MPQEALLCVFGDVGSLVLLLTGPAMKTQSGRLSELPVNSIRCGASPKLVTALAPRGHLPGSHSIAIRTLSLRLNRGMKYSPTPITPPWSRRSSLTEPGPSLRMWLPSATGTSHAATISPLVCLSTRYSVLSSSDARMFNGPLSSENSVLISWGVQYRYQDGCSLATPCRPKAQRISTGWNNRLQMVIVNPRLTIWPFSSASGLRWR